jgi:VWFA-related protein
MLVLGLVLAALCLAGSAQAVEGPAEAGRQEERLVFTSVQDGAGAPVEDLSASDFTIIENDVVREVLDVKRSTDPLRIALLVDTSEAVDRDVSNLRLAVLDFIKAVNGVHELALYEFGGRPALLADYSRDLTRHEAAARRLVARTGTGAYLLDAIVEASRDLRKREDLRPVIVVISSDGPEFSDRYHRTVLNELQRTGAALHAFVLDNRTAPLGRSQAAREREFTLADGTATTGGRREYLLTSMSLEDRLRALAVELKTQYQIVYSRPESLIPPGTLEVSVTRPGLTARGAQAWTTEGWRSHGRP